MARTFVIFPKTFSKQHMMSLSIFTYLFTANGGFIRRIIVLHLSYWVIWFFFLLKLLTFRKFTKILGRETRVTLPFLIRYRFFLVIASWYYLRRFNRSIICKVHRTEILEFVKQLSRLTSNFLVEFKTHR